MSIIKHVTLQKIVAHDFRYDLRIYIYIYISSKFKGNMKYLKKLQFKKKAV